MATISTTARPAYVYDAVGDQWVPIAWRVLPAGVGSAPALTFTGDSNTGLWSPAADTIAFSTGGVERVRVGSTLEVKSDNQAILDLYSANDTLSNAPALLRSFRYRGTLASPTAVTSGDTAFTLQARAYDGTQAVDLARISAVVDGTPGTNDMPGRLVFSTTADGASTTTERMRITSAGNVGIGTTSPAQRLEVSGTAAVDGSSPVVLRISDSAFSAGWTLDAPNAGIEFWSADTSTFSGTGAARVRASIQTRMQTANASGSDLTFNIDPADGTNVPVERMRITRTGNVGIGTTTPTSNLYINTDTQVSLANGTNGARSDGTLFLSIASGGTQGDGQIGPGLTFGRINSGRRGAMIASVQTSSDADQTGLLFAVRAATPTADDTLVEAMRITHAGNVGIGTSNPGTNLDVYSATSSIVRVRGDSTTFLSAVRYSADANGPQFLLTKLRGTNASPAATASGDVLGDVFFQGSDGSTTIVAAGIRAAVDATPGANDMPGRLTFLTTPDGSTTLTERMRIDNAGLITGTGTSLGAWTAFTPTWTNLTVGDGTLTAAYCQIGKVVYYYIYLIFGSTTAVTGAVSYTYPVTSLSTTRPGIHNVALRDASASTSYMGGWQQSSTTAGLVRSVGTNGQLLALSSTAPFTWATSDLIIISGIYEAS